jgi:hypothetical protein
MAKLIFSLALLMIALAIGFYFFSFLPTRAYEDNVRICGDKGIQRFDEISTGHELPGFTDIWADPTFYFNKKVGSCLMYTREAISAFQGANPTVTEMISNIYTNKTLIRTTYSNYYGQKTLRDGISPDQFDQQAQILLNQ